jgi:hypothetical protein
MGCYFQKIGCTKVAQALFAARQRTMRETYIN